MFNLEATLVSRSLNVKGTIQNFADDGICIHVQEDRTVCQLLNGMLFEVEFIPHSGDKIDLRCEVIRTHRKTDNSFEDIVGINIISKPPTYSEFLKNLH